MQNLIRISGSENNPDPQHPPNTPLIRVVGATVAYCELPRGEEVPGP